MDKIRRLAFLFLTFGIFAALLGCTGADRGESTGTIHVYMPKRENISRTLTVQGKVTAATKSVVTAPLGNKIIALNVTMGQRVAKGQALLRYDEGSVLADVTRQRNSSASRTAEIRNSELQVGGLQKR